MSKHVEQVSVGAYVRAAIAVSLFGVGALWLIRALIIDGLFLLASMISAVTVFLMLVYLRRRFSAMRWMAIGVAVAALFAVYPIVFNIYIGFTNMGSGHLFTKEQAIARLEAETHLDENAPTFRWFGYRQGESFALLLISDEGTAQFASQDGTIETVEVADPEQPPEELDGYTLMAQSEVTPIIDRLAAIEFGAAPTVVRVQSLREAAAAVPRYRFDSEQDAIVDLVDGTVYQAVEGSFVSDDGEVLIPGFMTGVGWDNFARFLTNDAVRNPLLRVLLWSFVFALGSVVISFIVGIGVAVLFEDLPGKRWIMALLIVPYPIPVLVSVLIWRSMLNPDLGTIGRFLERTFGDSPQFFLNPTWTRLALIMVNVWLSYPYFYVVTSGALRSIPHEMFDAAEVDGASPWKQFRFITFPQLVAIVMPLLIASFAFNFNNFNLIFIFNNGNPPMADVAIPIGHTDILISFIYKLAFQTASTSDYALGAAISVVLFLVVGTITYIQIRATRALEAT
ncbi:MAG TPA: ABC transporter permease subunit [Acidimicrobiia bacterium]|nr:ABC transporter permease subunit [Acidimicrobiia bacterium]